MVVRSALVVRRALAVLVAAVLLPVGGPAGAVEVRADLVTRPVSTPTGPMPTGRAVTMYGRPRSGLAWHTGFWAGGRMGTARMLAAEAWAGRRFDVVTAYPLFATWDQLSGDSSIALFDGWPGWLSYGLPMLPVDRPGRWDEVTSGAHDQVFAAVARSLVAHGRGDGMVRVGVESNGSWEPWQVTRATAPAYRAAFRRIVTVMRAQAPRLTFWLDLAAGAGLQGQRNRLDVLTQLYPGDAYVDGISMDHYDAYQLAARSAATWRYALAPSTGAGLADGAAFARAHRKGFAVPEWGLQPVQRRQAGQGLGDDPLFVALMHDFFVANRDVLVYEAYFNEPAPYIGNAIFSPAQNPRSAATYLSLFRR